MRTWTPGCLHPGTWQLHICILLHAHLNTQTPKYLHLVSCSRELPEYMRERQKDSYFAMLENHQRRQTEASSSELMIMTVQAKAASSYCSIM